MVTEVRETAFSQSKWGTGAQRATRINSLIAAWADPDKKKQRVTATQSDAAKEKRATSFKEWREENPGIIAQNLGIAHSANRKANEVRLKECLGDDPKQRLHELTVKLGLSTQEIADRIGKSRPSTRKLLIKYDEKPTYISNLSREEIDRRQGIYDRANTFGLVQNLPYRYPEIMTRLYSIGRQRVAMIDVGREFGGFTRERIRQIEEKYLKVLERKIDSMSFL